MDDADQHSALGEQEVKGLSILAIAQKKRRLHRHFLLCVALCLAFTLVMSFGGNALAASVGDVVTQVSKANFSSTEFNFGQESATGYGFAIHAGMGNFGSGGCVLSVLGPARPDEIQIMIDYVDSVSHVSYLRTTQLKGCEVREYVSEDGVGIGVVLPDYFITVEMLQTGQSQSADLASAKNIAQQTIDAMEKAGLLSQAAPDIEAGTSATEEQADKYPATAEPSEEPVRVADTTNIMAVKNGPTVPTTFSVNSPHLVTEIHAVVLNPAACQESCPVEPPLLRGMCPGVYSLHREYLLRVWAILNPSVLPVLPEHPDLSHDSSRYSWDLPAQLHRCPQ